MRSEIIAVQNGLLGMESVDSNLLIREHGSGAGNWVLKKHAAQDTVLTERRSRKG
jgi:hypothetical protein